MLAAVVLAWPDPATVLPTALVLAAMMVTVAVGFGIPAAHIPAAAAIALLWLVGFHLIRGDIGWRLADSALIKNAILSAASGHALVPLVAMFSLLAGWLRRLGRHGDARMFGLAAAATAFVSLSLVLWFGFGRLGDPTGTTWTLAIYAVAAVTGSFVLGKPVVALVTSALLFATLAQAIVYRFNPEWQLAQPWITALLAHATIVVIGCFVFGSLARRRQLTSALSTARRANVLRSFAFTAQVTSLAAAVWIVVTIQTTSPANAGPNLAWLAAVWVLVSVLAASPVMFTAAQVALVFAILCGVTAAVAPHDWYITAQHPWLDPWFLEVQGIALVTYCFLYGAVRRIVARLNGEDDERVVAAPPANWLTILRQLIDPPWPTVDRIVTVVLVVILSCVTIYAAAPGAMQEWSPTKVAGDRVVIPIERLELAHIPHAHAAAFGAWLLLGAVGITLAASLYRNRDSYWRLVGLVFVAMAVCPLLASRWEPQVAVASALRWISAGFFAAGSILVWRILRSSSAVVAGAMRDEEVTRPVAWTSTLPGIARSLRDLLVAFVVLLYVVMAAFVGQNALLGATVDASIHAMWPWAFAWAVVAGVAGLGASYTSTTDPRNSDRGASGSTFQYLLYARNLLLLLALAPIAILAAFAVARGLSQHPLVGPDPTSSFAKIGVAVSYGVPLVVIALTFVGYAVRDRAPGFAFSAGLLFNCVATLVVLLHLAHTGGKLDPAAWILVAQVNAIVTGVVALIWLAATTLAGSRAVFRSVAARSSEDASQRPYLLITQVMLAAAVCFVFLIPAAVDIVAAKPPAKWAASADGILGWIAVVIAAAAALWLTGRRAIGQNGVGLFASARVALLAFTVARTDNGNWQAYHTLLAGTCAIAWLLPLATGALNGSINRLDELHPPLDWSALPARLFAVAAVGLSIGGYLHDPARPWWTLAVLVAISARNIWIAYREDRRGGIWIAAVLLLPATTIWWFDWASKLSYFRNFRDGFELIWINVLATAILAVISVWLERRCAIVERQSSPSSASPHPARRRPAVVPFHRIAAWAIVVILMLTTAGGLVADLLHDSFLVSWPLAWGTWFAAAIVAVACLWDPAVRWSAACGYCIGLVAVGMYLDGLNLHAPLFHWALANALAAYSLATSALGACATDCSAWPRA